MPARPEHGDGARRYAIHGARGALYSIAAPAPGQGGQHDHLPESRAELAARRRHHRESNTENGWTLAPRAPSRLIRPRPIDCDRGPKQRVKIFPVFGSNFVKKKFFQKVHDLVLIYTPKEAHSRIFVTGGLVIA